MDRTSWNNANQAFLAADDAVTQAAQLVAQSQTTLSQHQQAHQQAVQKRAEALAALNRVAGA